MARMHGEKETSYAPRLIWMLAHAAIVLFAGWFLVFDGFREIGAWIGVDWAEGHAGRRGLLLAFGIVMWVRMSFGALLFLKRRFDWSECLAVTFACAVYQIGFAAAGVSTATPLGFFDLLAAALYLAGSAVNSFSELERTAFKADPENQGKLYTGGLFAWVRHPNYFGDIVWLSGWALLTLNPWAFLLPVLATAGFVFFFIPQLSAHLASRYGDDYAAWAASTKKLIPYIY